MTRILLLGADGQLGTELRPSLSPVGEIVPATLSKSHPQREAAPSEIMIMMATSTS